MGKISSNIKNIIIEYIANNSKQYLLVILIFLIGIFAGVMFINNSKTEEETEITSNITEFIDKFKTIEKIDKPSLIIDSIKENTLYSIIIWIAGTTIIGLPVVLGLIIFKGFCIGVSLSRNSINSWNAKRFIILYFSIFTAKHYIYTSNINNGSK